MLCWVRIALRLKRRTRRTRLNSEIDGGDGCCDVLCRVISPREERSMGHVCENVLYDWEIENDRTYDPRQAVGLVDESQEIHVLPLDDPLDAGGGNVRSNRVYRPPARVHQSEAHSTSREHQRHDGDHLLLTLTSLAPSPLPTSTTRKHVHATSSCPHPARLERLLGAAPLGSPLPADRTASALVADTVHALPDPVAAG